MRMRKAAFAAVGMLLLLLLLLRASGCAASIGDRWASLQDFHSMSRHCPIGHVPLCKREIKIFKYQFVLFRVWSI